LGGYPHQEKVGNKFVTLSRESTLTPSHTLHKKMNVDFAARGQKCHIST
jgi:hypothetical protein